jgi:hypothetical protein
MSMRTLVVVCLVSVAVTAAAGGGGGGCASSSTKIVKTWRDPSFKGPIDFKRTLVVAVDPDRYSRNAAEDTIVERIGAARSVAAHDLLAENERQASKHVLAKLDQAGVDGVVMIAVVDRRTLVSRDTTAASSESFYSYYDRSSAFVTSDAGAKASSVYQVETRIYAVQGGRLLWSALSDTIDPKDTRTAVMQIAKTVGAELRKEKLLR